MIATAPHGADELIYPGTCRAGMDKGREARSIRVRVSDEEISFGDGVIGSFSQRLSEACGDFVIRRADGLFAYHLATVVDDADSRVDQVVRGADLLASTPRQIYLQRLLEVAQPQYFHLPLVTAPSGAKLSKRDCAVSIASGRDLETDGGNLLAMALSFLGQDVACIDPSAPPKEILSMALTGFDPARVPVISHSFQEIQ